MSETISADRPIVVVKIGGSILKDAQAYRRAARFVCNRHFASPDERLVVVVSAQEGVTDGLAACANRIVNQPNPSTLDLLWSIGELQSVAILALHLQALGISPAALNVHEAGLTVRHGDRGSNPAPREVCLNPGRLHSALVRHPVAVVPGFFATDSAGSVVSLGRGGSDLTAVLLAKGLRAVRCELVKDVPGYFTSDPHKNSQARHLSSLTFDEAITFADDGCELVQRQAIETAARCNLPLVIRGLEEGAPFSLLTAEPRPGTASDAIDVAVVAT